MLKKLIWKKGNAWIFYKVIEEIKEQLPIVNIEGESLAEQDIEKEVEAKLKI